MKVLLLALTIVSILMGCSSRAVDPQVREASGSDPIAAVFKNCADLFSKHSDSRSCEFVEDRGNAGADIVRERITCTQAAEYVTCKGRPGEGPGPEEYRLDFRCSRATRQCEITSGAPSYVEAFTPLFESYNRALTSDPRSRSTP
jgi:hypothetical protein